jgi:hypothetical protein
MTDNTPRKKGPPKRYPILVLFSANVVPELRARIERERGNSNHERLKNVMDELDALRLEHVNRIEAERREYFDETGETREELRADIRRVREEHAARIRQQEGTR